MERGIEIRAVIYTAMICFIIFLLMLIYKITVKVEESIKFTEVIFVPPIEEQVQTLNRGESVQGFGKSSLPSRIANLPKINLPTRLILTEEEILLHKFAEKIDAIERKGVIEGIGFGVNKVGDDASFGKEIKPEVGISGVKRNGIGEIKRDFGGGISPKFSYHIEWEGKINRIKVGGELPRFPQGIKESAVVRFRVVVLPDGTIERIFPLEKANPDFERSAFEALRTWRFNPISENIKQSGVITFNFRVE
ncbi:energy transducer TonB family protein [Candidatus Kryptobacter tengchongensis]|uniref:TonB family C-terminal domain-containing protein n=1 Tax=Kryptobacter tengchongensis TaxID=1643429 RepID=A0A656D6Y1_KRYT1|nr:energy transducer TonB [Candidatus Kryptobacter tengchongensis]CUT00924.1 TonB family C-terminal domain-containing protein [Candidatus Kryptobacter tengchongensis]